MSNSKKDTVGSSEAEQMEHRRGKLTALRARGDAFSNKFRRSADAEGEWHNGRVNQQYSSLDKTDVAERAVTLRLAGRLVNRRGPFSVVEDGFGSIQFYVRKDTPADVREAVAEWDIGDVVGGEGVLAKSDRGALYIDLQKAWLLTKSLRPLADQYYGVADQDLRYRRRYLDLIVNKDSRRVFETRSKIIAALRQFLLARQFLEVETPMMHPLHSSGNARPFTTHHNTLDMDLYLRVAPELYLKRLVVGGFERVFELNRSFRNEGLSPKHNPEFTMLEFYQAYANYEDLMDLTEQMVRDVTQATLGTTRVTYQNQVLDFGKPIPRLTVDEILQQRAALTSSVLNDREQLAALARENGIGVQKEWGKGRLKFELFEALIEATITEPVFVTGHPTEISPLARRSDSNPEVTDRFELFVMGREIANGFSELNDPEDQAARFRAQALLKSGGDPEAMQYDEDYITALEYGMPPTAGEGVGIDRLVMLLTDQPSIRDVLLFPLMRSREG